MKYKSDRIIDGKRKKVIVDVHGMIINKDPSKEELKSTCFKHNETETCDRCGKNFDKVPGNPLKEKDEKGNWTGRWDCANCWQKFSQIDSFGRP